MDNPINIEILQEIGLTDSEIKVYFALLDLGTSKKAAIVKKAKITSSKIYEVMDKLIEKGLASSVVENKIKHFTAAPPNRIRLYLKQKQTKLKEQEDAFKKILPILNLKHKLRKEQTDAEVYRGWKGMTTVYNDILETLKPNQCYYIYGASKGEDKKKVKSFYSRFNNKAIKKKLKANIIFNENARGNILNVKQTGKVRYLKQTTPAEIVVYSDKTAIVLLEQEPLIILIHGKSIANSFKAFFDVMWLMAKE